MSGSGTLAEPPIFLTNSDRVGQRAVRGVAITSLSQGVKLLAQFGSVIILARLITPADFGIFAMVSPIVGFAMLFQDFGLSQAMIAKRDLTSAQAATMFRLNLGIAGTIAILLSVLAIPLSWFYNQPLVAPITWLLCVQVVMAGLTVSHVALLARALRFGQLAIMEISATLFSFAVAVFVAWHWPGPWAPVMQAVSSAAALMVGAWLATRWMPRRFARLDEVKDLIHFGKGLTGFNLSNYVSRNADNLLIGWAQGPAQLGFYDRAYKLLLFPIAQVNAPIQNVLVPVLSRLRGEPERYRAAYVRTLSMMLLVTTPGVAILIVTADKLVRLLLGEGWLGAIPVFTWLSLAAVHQPVSNTFGWLLISQQRTSEFARYGIFAMLTCLLSFMGGLAWGATGVAAAYAISGLVLRLPVLLWTVGRKGPVTAGVVLRTAAPYFLAAIIGAVSRLVADPYFPADALINVLCSAVWIYAVSFAVLLLTRTGRRAIGEVVTMVKNKLFRG